MRTGHSYYYYIFMYTLIDYLKHGIHDLRCPPFLPYGVQLQVHDTYTQHGNRTNRIRPRKPVMSLSFPTLPKQPGLTTVFRLPLHLWLGMCIGDLSQGPRTRHLVLFQFKFVPLFLQGGNYAASRRTAGVYTHTGHLNGSKGRHIRPYGNLTVIYNQVEA